MTEEEIKELKYNIIWWKNRYLSLSKRHKQLQQRIDKAIEYIECALSEDKETPSKYGDWRLDLLEMLKGDNNE